MSSGEERKKEKEYNSSLTVGSADCVVALKPSVQFLLRTCYGLSSVYGSEPQYAVLA